MNNQEAESVLVKILPFQSKVNFEMHEFLHTHEYDDDEEGQTGLKLQIYHFHFEFVS